MIYTIIIEVESDLEQEQAEYALDGILRRELDGHIKYLGMPCDPAAGEAACKARQKRTVYYRELRKLQGLLEEDKLTVGEFFEAARRLERSDI